MDSTERGDEVTLAQYQMACKGIELCGQGLANCMPDEAAEHWLPKLTQEISIVFSYVGDNMTGRHVPRYVQTVDALQRAKDRT